jgi:acyl-CoA synthetase (AMP-forming)/AMP-acid ligase II
MNLAQHLVRAARELPGLDALRWPGGSITFAELERKSSAIAHGLAERGLGRGDRAALLVRPGPELVAIVFALFRIGAVPVLVDPGMGRAGLVRCFARMQPTAFLGVPLAHFLARADLRIRVGPGWFPGTTSLAALARPEKGAFAPLELASEDPAAILFTSGSTGPAKGVLYTHGNFEAQIESLRALYGLARGQVDLACFPLFALFNTALQRTSVFPRMDASAPARCDPAAIVEALQRNAATDTFGSPAIWRRVVPWCVRRGEKLPALERAMIAGASVEPALVEGLRALLSPTGDVHTPYGATEALPVSSLSGAEITGRLRARIDGGHGTCVGRPAPGVEIALVRMSDDRIARWSEDLRVPPLALGEICVRGPVVTPAYDGDEAATRAAKIEDGARLWHRMGDIGYLDAEGLLWFCGRKSQRLETALGTFLPVPTESIFDRHPKVRRSALVGVGPRGSEVPVLVVEGPRREQAELVSFARANTDRKLPHPLPEIEHVLFRESLPVDARHNAKIAREELKRWAEGELA